MRKFVAGHCPAQDDERIISVDYTEVRAIGMDPVLKAYSFICDDANDCSEKNCPIFLQADIIAL